MTARLVLTAALTAAAFIFANASRAVRRRVWRSNRLCERRRRRSPCHHRPDRCGGREIGGACRPRQACCGSRLRRRRQRAGWRGRDTRSARGGRPTKRTSRRHSFGPSRRCPPPRPRSPTPPPSAIRPSRSCSRPTPTLTRPRCRTPETRSPTTCSTATTRAKSTRSMPRSRRSTRRSQPRQPSPPRNAPSTTRSPRLPMRNPMPTPRATRSTMPSPRPPTGRRSTPTQRPISTTNSAQDGILDYYRSLTSSSSSSQ